MNYSKKRNFYKTKNVQNTNYETNNIRMDCSEDI